MENVFLMVHNQYLDPLMKSLQEAALLQVEDLRAFDQVKDHVQLPEEDKELRLISELELRLSKVIEIFKLSPDPKPGSVKMLIKPPVPQRFPVDLRPWMETKEEDIRALEELEQILLPLEKRIQEIDDNLDQIEEDKTKLLPFMDLDLPLHHLGESEHVHISAGMTYHPDELRKALGKVEHHLELVPLSKEHSAAIIIVHKSQRKKLNTALTRELFIPLELDQKKGTPAIAVGKMREASEKLKEERKGLLARIRATAKDWKKIVRILLEETKIEKHRREIVSYSGSTSTTSLITGWCPRKDIDKLKKLASKTTKDHCEVLTEDPRKEPPILMQNPRALRPFESLTRMFAPPNYDEIDPTFLIAPAFILFFGLMLGDTIYGALVLITGIIVYRGMGKVNQTQREFAIILCAIGVSAMVFGILMGSYLGPLDENNPFYHMFNALGIEPWYAMDAMKDPITLLVIALIIGIIQLVIGIVLAFAHNIRMGNRKDALFGQGSWFFLLPCGGILIANFFGWAEFTGILYQLASIGTLVGLALLAGGAKSMAFFELTGFIGNWLSYARLLALGLATGGIALTINLISSLILGFESEGPIIPLAMVIVGTALTLKGHRDQSPFIKNIGLIPIILGAVAFIDFKLMMFAAVTIVIIFAHLINAALQALGAFIHSLRLQYVEFFGQFYSGGGKQFTPFQAERKVTYIAKEGKQ